MNRIVFALVLSFTAISVASAASVDEIDVHWISQGDGPAIVFVHGWTCDTTVWEAQMDALDADYRVIALDLPGHGKSGSPADGRYSMDLFARAIEAVRAEAGLDNIALVGHSMGVPVIRQYAIDYPDRVAGLIGVDGGVLLPIDEDETASSPPQLPPSREAMIRGMFVPQTTEALQEQILELMLSVPDDRAFAIGGSIRDPSARTAEVVTAPVLGVLAGSTVVPNLEPIREVFPKLEVFQIPETGHFLMMEKPAEFNRLMSAFLMDLDF